MRGRARAGRGEEDGAKSDSSAVDDGEAGVVEGGEELVKDVDGQVLPSAYSEGGEDELELVGAEDVVGGVVDGTTQELPMPQMT